MFASIGAYDYFVHCKQQRTRFKTSLVMIADRHALLVVYLVLCSISILGFILYIALNSANVALYDKHLHNPKFLLEKYLNHSSNLV